MMGNVKRLKVVLCANSSWYIYNFRINTIKAMLGEGHRVLIVAPKDEYSKYFDDMGVDHSDVYIDAKSLNPLKELRTILSLVMTYAKNRPDYIMNFTPKMNIYSSLASLICGAKVVNNISGLGVAFKNDSWLSRLVIRLYRVSQKLAIRVFFQNRDDMKLFISQKIVSGVNAHLLPGSGVDLTRFSPVDAPNDGVVRFVIVCRMLYEKGVTIFVEASRHFKKRYGDMVQFRAVGFIGKDRGSIPRSIIDGWVKEGLIVYCGALKDVRPELGLADCVVLPSFYPEGTPKCLLEAGAMGKPVVTTDTPGCSSTVDNGINGFLILPNSLEDLIVHLEKIVEMKHLERLKMGQRARLKMEQEFDEQFVIDKYMECLEL